jgi:hypothetical protein
MTTRGRSAGWAAGICFCVLAIGAGVADAQGQQAAAEGAAPGQFQAPHLALDHGATACVGVLEDALKLTIDPNHQELSSWHPTQAGTRTFWAAAVDHGGARGSYVAVTPTEDRHCDAATVRVAYLAQSCKSAVAALGKSAADVETMGEATVIRRDAAGRLSMYLPGGAGCVHVEMATLYGR